MTSRENALKLICMGAMFLSIYSVYSLMFGPSQSDSAQFAAQSASKKNMAPFNAEFWKTANLREKEIPSAIADSASEISVSELTVMVKGSSQFCQVCLPPAGVPPTGQFLLFLHGAAFSSQTWRDLGTLQLMTALGHTVVAIDLPGYGKSPSSSVPPSADFLPAVVTSLSPLPLFRGRPLKRPVLVSPSMSGGYSIPLLRQQTKVPAQDAFLSGYVPVAPVKTQMLSPEEARNLEVPTLIVRGEKDHGLGTSSENDLKEIPPSQIWVLPEAGHPAYLNQPKLFHQLLYNFMALVKENNPPSSF